ncbi:MULTISPECIES: transcriptional regulator [Rahnella]|uniref:Transcriptional regulator n=1 Tax=Rahnella laticis TaxID=2787622 RepID=A0ABS0EBV8_9GAMM|nr:MULTISPECIES: transcriptional regulator [Rahnella]MBF7982565.1 transcriptional regulator [Rahnella laticis]MBF8002653.1 transcriptional regulator [Rahnella sp. LAC-M12]
MRTQATLQKWGNSIALRLSGNLKSIPQFEEGDVVDIEVSEEGLQIRKAKGKKLTEAELISGLDAYTAHADEMVQPISKELGY